MNSPSNKKNLSFFVSMVLLITVLMFNRVGAQTITSYSPSSGPIGTTVTITGNNFSPSPTSNIVFFGATQAAVASATTTQLAVVVPPGATYQPISVLVNGLTAYSRVPYVVTFPGGDVFHSTSFAERVDFQSGNSPRATGIGDFDGDGKPDLAVVNYTGNSVSIFKNISTVGKITKSSFASRVDFATSTNPQSIVIGDLDGDGRLDLAVTTACCVSIFKNTSTAGVITFATQIEVAIGGGDVTLGDMDQDGKADLVIASKSTSTVSIFRNTSNAGVISASSFNSRVDVSIGGYDLSGYVYTSLMRMIALSDVDGDGKLDLVTENNSRVYNFSAHDSFYYSYNNAFSVYRNTSTPGLIAPGSFQRNGGDQIWGGGSGSSTDYSLNFKYYNVAVGDLDGDQKFEFISVLTSILAVAIDYTLPPGLTVIVDKDVIFPGPPLTRVIYATGAMINPQVLTLGDLDGEGHPDIVVTDGLSISIIDGSFHDRVAINVNLATRDPYNSLAIGDLDGDGRADLVVVNNNGTVSIIKNGACTSPIKPTITPNTSNPAAPVLTSSAGDGYQWFLDGLLIAEIGHSLTASKTGVYTVRVSVDGCVSALSDPVSVVVTPPPVVTGDISINTSEVSVYPIPAREQIFVTGASLNSGNWAVFSVLGKESQPPFEVSRDGSLIDIRDLSSGMYILRVSDGKKTVTVKFIKE